MNHSIFMIETVLKLPKFEGGSFGLLEGEFGEIFLKIYKGMIHSYFKGNEVLNVLEYNKKKGVVTGSNVFAVILAYDILSQNY